MRPSTDPADLSPDQRLSELARILAVGVLRLQKIRLLREIRDEAAANSAAGGLDVQAKTVLSGRNG